MKHLDEFRQLRLHAGREVAVPDQEIQGHRRARDLEILTKQRFNNFYRSFPATGEIKLNNVQFFARTKMKPFFYTTEMEFLNIIFSRGFWA
jgi:hypothetical protein